jgi:nitroreductase
VFTLEFLEAVKGRRSIRKFLPEPVPVEDLEEIIRIGTLAPSAGNQQDWRFLAVVNQELKDRMKEIVQKKLYAVASHAGEAQPESYSNRPSSLLFAGAPVALVVLTRPYRGKMDELMKDVGYSEAEIDYLRMRPDLQTIGGLVQTLLLAAYSLGYGSCWMVAPNTARHELEELLEVKPPWAIAAVVALGRPAQAPGGKKVKPVSEVLQVLT